uniref:Uncharacterized protein n=1 Tax=Strigamia maritima TaxID=126957 RepID=T1IYF2_STRMM
MHDELKKLSKYIPKNTKSTLTIATFKALVKKIGFMEMLDLYGAMKKGEFGPKTVPSTVPPPTKPPPTKPPPTKAPADDVPAEEASPEAPADEAPAEPPAET